MVSPESISVSTLNVGSSATILPIAILIFSVELLSFGVTEIDIDFDHIPDTIDTNEANFSSTTAIPTTSENGNETSTSSSTKQPAMIASIKLKKHKDVLYEMYKVAKKKAQEAKKVAIRTYLEAKEIKAAYLLDDSDLSESDDDDVNI